jgi:hypothetical protein
VTATSLGTSRPASATADTDEVQAHLRPEPWPPADQTPTHPRRPDQRVRTRSLKPQVSQGSPVLEPDRQDEGERQ